MFRIVIAVAAATLLAASSAQATTILLSEQSSDSTPAGQLSAALDFQVAGSTLTLTVDNNTGGTASFQMVDVYFNVLSNVTTLTLTSAIHSVNGDVTAGWSIGTGDAADGFGTFDFSLIDGVGLGNPNAIDAGESIVFTLSISGTGPFDANDFVDLSTNPPGSIQAYAAAMFTSCVGSGCIVDDDSAFGSSSDPAFVIPEPATLALLGLGLVGLTARRRRQA
jgi:hypothetical protein